MKSIIPARIQIGPAYPYFELVDLNALKAEGVDPDVVKKLWEGHNAEKNVIEFDANPDLCESYDAEFERAMDDPRAKVISTDEPDGVPRIYLFNNTLDVKSAAELVQMKADDVVEIKDPLMVKFLKRTDERFVEYLKSRGIPEDTDFTVSGYEEENAEYEKIQREEFEKVMAEMDEERNT